jgi:hypothetical protein
MVERSYFLARLRKSITAAKSRDELSNRPKIRCGCVTAGLETASCECYRLINREYTRLLKPDRKK